MGRLLAFLLIVSLIGTLFLYGGAHSFLAGWLAAFVALLQHIFCVLLDFIRGAILLVLNTIRELFGL